MGVRNFGYHCSEFKLASAHWLNTELTAHHWTSGASSAKSLPIMPGVGLMVRMVGLGSEDPELKSHSAVELIPGGVDSACHPSKVGKNECQNSGIPCRSGDPSRIVSNSQGDCSGSTNALHRVWSQYPPLPIDPALLPPWMSSADCFNRFVDSIH